MTATTPSARASTRRRLVLLTLTAVVASGVVAYFLVTQPAIGLKTPSRAAGSLLGLAVWGALALVAATRVASARHGLGSATLVLAVLAAFGSVALAAIHVAAHVAGWQTIAVALLGVVAAGLAVGLRKA